MKANEVFLMGKKYPSFSLILKRGVSFKGKITEMKYRAERKLEEGLKAVGHVT